MAQNRFSVSVSQASLNQTALDWPRNFKNICAAIDAAASNGSDILALEELTITGYDCGDNFAEIDNATVLRFLYDVAAYAQIKAPHLIISIGHPFRVTERDIEVQGPRSERRKSMFFNRKNKPFNMQSFMAGGRILGMTAKTYLFDYERGYESRYFQEWSMEEANARGGIHGTINVSIPGADGAPTTVPVGRPVIQLQDHKNSRYAHLCHVICEEKWVATQFDAIPSANDAAYDQEGVLPDIAAIFGQKGLVAIMPNASPPTLNKMPKHEHLAALASRYADLVVDTDGLGSSGATFAQFGYKIAAQNGAVIHQGPRLETTRASISHFKAQITNANPHSPASAAVEYPFPNANRPVSVDAPASQGWDNPANPHRSHEEWLRMTALWLYDYMRKTKCKGIVEALSGGADSTFNSAMVMVMVRMAMTELGVDGFLKDMAHLSYAEKIRVAYTEGGLDKAVSVCMDNMFTAVYMGTNNSSDATRNAARGLMQGGVTSAGISYQGIGGQYHERNVQDILDFYAVAQVLENSSALDPVRKHDIIRDLAKFLNTRAGSMNPAEMKAWEQNIKSRYPEISGDLISTFKPEHGLAYENIQARGRQVLVMLFANKEGKMAIANPNLDEARNSYATFGGDLHSGTINLNAHINKDLQLELMRYLRDHGLQGVCAPITALDLALKNKPTAELQPKDKDGKVVQNDEDALQRSFAQMNRIGELITGVYDTSEGPRRLNPAEVFGRITQDTLFKPKTEKTFPAQYDYDIYSQLAFSYQRWWLAQHKIHASPIAPTGGHNVDHQSSLRTPNLSGQHRSELAVLGLSLVFKAAADSGKAVSQGVQDECLFRAARDEVFVDAFHRHAKGDSVQAFKLKQIEDVFTTGDYRQAFGTLDNAHPLMPLYEKYKTDRKLVLSYDAVPTIL